MAYWERESTAQIAKRAKSNLAFALLCLPKPKQKDMIDFYAFCRVVDDIADEEDWPVEKRAALLAQWKEGLQNGFSEPNDTQLATERLRETYPIPTEHFVEIIQGVEADLQPRRFATQQDLLDYCYLVASVVGLVSIEIFGYQHESARDYAVKLGHALQWTNILRDVGEDARDRQRLYLPEADLRRFDYREEDLFTRLHDERFVQLMEFEYAQASRLYQEASELLHPDDRQNMLPAEVMRKIYSGILEKMRHDRFRVFEQRYRLSKLHMAWLIFSSRFLG
ncbi:MAG: squalene/phytoene synthase family protein [Verrucomicrobiota bacterium]